MYTDSQANSAVDFPQPLAPLSYRASSISPRHSQMFPHHPCAEIFWRLRNSYAEF